MPPFGNEHGPYGARLSQPQQPRLAIRHRTFGTCTTTGGCCGWDSRAPVAEQSCVVVWGGQNWACAAGLRVL